MFQLNKTFCESGSTSLATPCQMMDQPGDVYVALPNTWLFDKQTNNTLKTSRNVMNLSVPSLHNIPSWLGMPDVREVSIQKLVTCQRLFVNSILNTSVIEFQL